jgi:transposase
MRLGTGEVEMLGKIGTTQAEIDCLCKRLQSKARHVYVAYEAAPCGYGLYRQLVGKGFDCMVCAPSLIPKKPGERVTTDRSDAVKLVRSRRATGAGVQSVTDRPANQLPDAVVLNRPCDLPSASGPLCSAPVEC